LTKSSNQLKTIVLQKLMWALEAAKKAGFNPKKDQKKG
jgi:hypothetical protein